MAIVKIKMPDGSEREDYFSTLDDLFFKLRLIEEGLDKVDETTKRKAESIHNKFVFTLVTGTKRKQPDGSEVDVTRSMLDMSVEVVPI